MLRPIVEQSDSKCDKLWSSRGKRGAKLRTSTRNVFGIMRKLGNRSVLMGTEFLNRFLLPTLLSAGYTLRQNHKIQYNILQAKTFN